MRSLSKSAVNLPGLLSDWLKSDSLVGQDLFELDLFPARRGVNIPSANVAETPKEFIVELAAPGLDRKDFNIEVDNHKLMISVEKESETEEKNGYLKKEYSYHSFSRTFTLPENVKEDLIAAKYDQGVLKVTIPKQKETAANPPKKVAVA